MPLMVLGLVFASALLIFAVVLVSPHMQRRRLARNDGAAACSNDSGWSPAAFSSDGGGSDCSGTTLSEPERVHARLAYLRPPGNLDLDRDPTTFQAFIEENPPLVTCNGAPKR